MTENAGLDAVWKFPLLKQNNTLEMPTGSKVLTVGLQQGELCLWAQVPTLTKLMELRSFHVIGTGMQWHSSHDVRYVGTIIVGPPDHLVWHIYEYTGEALGRDREAKPLADQRRNTEGAA